MAKFLLCPILRYGMVLFGLLNGKVGAQQMVKRCFGGDFTLYMYRNQIDYEKWFYSSPTEAKSKQKQKFSIFNLFCTQVEFATKCEEAILFPHVGRRKDKLSILTLCNFSHVKSLILNYFAAAWNNETMNNN